MIWLLGVKTYTASGKEVHLDVVPELRRIPRFVLDVQQGLQPLVPQALCGRLLRPGALYSQCAATPASAISASRRCASGTRCSRPGTNQRGVQRLVAVEFGNRDVVFELAGHWLVHLVQTPGPCSNRSRWAQ